MHASTLSRPTGGLTPRLNDSIAFQQNGPAALALHVSTAPQRPVDRLPFWTQYTAAHSQALVVPNTPVHDYRAALSIYKMADAIVIEAICDPLGFRGLLKQAKRTHADNIWICYCKRVNGGIETNGRASRIFDGVVHFQDSRGFGNLWTHDVLEATALSIPRAWVSEIGKVAADFDGAVFAADHFMTKRMAERVEAAASHAKAASPTAFSQAMADLRLTVEDAFAARASKSHCQNLLLKMRRVHSIRAYLDGHAAELNLAPDRVADALGLARSTLYRLLREDGLQVNAYIAEYRLAAIARMLRDPIWFDRPIGEMASLWGYVDHSHFSRAFRRRFGVTPSQWRAEGPVPGPQRAHA